MEDFAMEIQADEIAIVTGMADAADYEDFIHGYGEYLDEIEGAN